MEDDALLAGVLRRLLNEIYGFSGPWSNDSGEHPPSIGLDGSVELSMEEFEAIKRTGLIDDYWLQEG